MPDNPMRQVGRLALREEGTNWVAYYALTDTLEGAIFLGSIAMRFVQVEEQKKRFMDLMRDCLSDLMEEKFGVRPKWGGPQRAPESERSGSA